MTEQQAKDILASEKYTDIAVVTFQPNHMHTEHTHDRQTLQIIIHGDLTVTDKNRVVLYKIGDRLESPPGTTHSATAGAEGCAFAVGMK